jgi:hypothetical protein
MKKRVDTATVEQLKTRMAEAPARQTLRPYDVIAELAEGITNMQSRGYDIDDITALLQAEGIQIARNTVRTYLSRALKARANPHRLASAASSTASRLQSAQDSVRAQNNSQASVTTAQIPNRAILPQRPNTVDSSSEEPQLRPGTWTITPDRERL